MTTDVFTWLHISDTHFREQPEYAQNLAAEELMRCVREHQGFGPVHAVFFTGDLAHGGKQQEYDEGLRFLELLCKATKLTPECVFIVPGNHDVDWTLIRPYHKLELPAVSPGDGSGVASQALHATDELFGDTRTLELLGEKSSGFKQLASKYPWAWRNGRHPYVARVFEHANRRIAVAGLNSAWFVSGKKEEEADRERLLLGRRLVKKALDDVNGLAPDIIFVLMHHPLEWLFPWEREDLSRVLLQQRAVVLCGHRHRNASWKLVEPRGQALYAQAGALYENAKHPKHFTMGQWDPASGIISICPFVHPDAGTSTEWDVDNTIFGSATNGIGTFPGFTARRDTAPLAKTAGPLRLLSVQPKNKKAIGCLADAVGSVYVDAPQDALAQVFAIHYVCKGGAGQDRRWVNRACTERFVETFRVTEKEKTVIVEAEAEFTDRSRRSLDPVTLTCPP